MSTFPDRSKSLLSGEEIINFKQNSLKDVPAGSKDYAPDDSWLEQKQIQATLETHHSLVGAQRIEKKSNLSSAEWLPEVGKAKVKKKAGKHWEVFGHTVNSEDWLLPEEALFLLETSSLELYLEGVPLSVEQSYALIVGEFISFEEYRVYSHLSRKGYRLMRHDKEISVTPYEKDIHADQVCLAAKRSVPGSKTKSRAVSNEGSSSRVSEQVSGEVSSGANVSSIEDVCMNEDVTTASANSNDDGVCTAVSQNDGIGTASTSSLVGTISPVSSNSAACAGASQYPIGSAAPGPSEETPTIEEASSKDGDSTVPSAADASASSTDGIGTTAPVCPAGGSIASAVSSDLATPTGASILPGDPLVTRVPVASEGIPVLDKTAAEALPPSVSPLASRISISDSVEPNQRLEANCSPSDSDSSQNRPVPSAEAPKMVNKGKSLIVRVQELISLDSEGSEDVIFTPDTSETPDATGEMKAEVSMDIDDSSSEDAFPRSPSPDLKVVEAGGQVIEIEEGSSSEEDTDVIFTGVKSTEVDTVNLLDSDDDDDDVVFIYQKPGNTDPSKWRKRFLKTTEFVNFRFAEKPEEVTKSSKIKLIDLFDLGRKTFDSVWKAIPRHDGNDEFINAPDQRFIPSTILPKFAQYRISLHQRDVSPVPDNQMPNVDTTRNLNQIVQYGQEPSYFARNENYSFHRSRGSWKPPGFSSYASRPPRNQVFGENRGRVSNYRGHDRNPQPSNSHNRFGNQNRNAGNFFNQNLPTNFQPQGNFASPFGNPNQLEGIPNDGLKLAVMQAYQLQMLAVGLMQSCQSIMQQVPGLTNANSFPANNFGNNVVGNFPQPQQYYRGQRTYRRPWRGQGRRRYLKGDKSGSSRVTEIPAVPDSERTEVVLIGSDDEDNKVKPVVKRSVALNAIAGLNVPKRKRMKISTKVKSIKLDVDASPSVPIVHLDEVSSVKSESSRVSTKQESVKSENKQDVRPLTKSEEATPTKTSVAEPAQAVESVPEDSVDSQPAVDSDNSRPSAIVYDEQVSVDSDSAVSGKSLDAPVSDQSYQPMEVADPDTGASPAVGPDYQPTPLSNSWKSYKEQKHPLDEQPSCSKALVSAGRERSMNDVMNSLRVIGPIEDAEALREEFRVSYDVYLPNQPFRKSVRLLPKYRVIIAKSDFFPTALELNRLETTYRDNVPFLYAVVTLDAIKLYNLRPVCLPSVVLDAYGTK